MTLALAWLTHPSDGQIAEALALLAAADAADGFHAVSEAAMLRLRPHPSARAGVHLLARNPEGTLVGYAAVDECSERRTAEFAVHPEHRCRGVGGAMLAALLDRAGGPLWLWAHGEHPGALRLVQRAGLVSKRALYQLRRGLADPIPPRRVPDGVAVRSFGEAGVDAVVQLPQEKP